VNCSNLVAFCDVRRVFTFSWNVASSLLFDLMFSYRFIPIARNKFVASVKSRSFPICFIKSPLVLTMVSSIQGFMFIDFLIGVSYTSGAFKSFVCIAITPFCTKNTSIEGNTRKNQLNCSTSKNHSSPQQNSVLRIYCDIL